MSTMSPQMTTPARPDGDAGTAGPSRRIEDYWYLPVVAGVVAVAVGVLVLARPNTTLTALSVIVGIYLLIVGGLAIAHVFVSRDDQDVGTGWLFMGILSLIAGLVVVRHPSESLVAVSLAIGIWFVVAGALDLSRAIIRPYHRLIALIRGLVLIAAGTVIISSPDIGVKTLALITGIALCLQGVVQIAEGLVLRSLRSER